MTTPPSDPTQPRRYGQPQDAQPGPSGWEGATNGFGEPFVPLPDQPQQGQPQQRQPQYGQPQYGQPQHGQGQPQYGQPGVGANPYAQQGSPYGQPGYPYGPGGYPPYFPPTPPRNGMATAGMVLGIISVVLFFFSFFDLPIAIVGFTLSMVALNRSKVLAGAGRGFAIAGIATSVVGFLLAGIMSIYLINRMQDCSDYEIGSTSWSTCVTEE